MKAIDIDFSQKSQSNDSGRKRVSALILSILLHGIVFSIFILIEFEFISQGKNSYATITLVERTTYHLIPEDKSELKLERDNRISQKEEVFDKNDPLARDINDIDSNTTERNQQVLIPQTELKDNYENLKFAESLLDTFLILNPEYSRYILGELAKNIERNPDYKKSFAKAELEKRINDELHKYISEKFPQGSQHEINKHTGPGINIPIGDLIDIIRKIF